MSIAVILFSIGLVAVSAVLLQLKRINQYVFAAIMALMVVMDFAILSLDKIYFLHQEQDQHYVEKLRLYDEHMSHQRTLFEQLTQVQLNMALQLLKQNSKQENEHSIAQKLLWRDQLIIQLKALNFEEKILHQVRTEIDMSVHAYLMEELNRLLIQNLGHRNYGEFVRRRSRDEWTDELFVKELQPFLTQENLMTPDIQFALNRIKEFRHSGLLMGKGELAQ